MDPQSILQVMGRELDLDPNLIRVGKQPEKVIVRQIALSLIVSECRSSFKTAGQRLGVSHTAARNAVARVNQLCKDNARVPIAFGKSIRADYVKKVVSSLKSQIRREMLPKSSRGLHRLSHFNGPVFKTGFVFDKALHGGFHPKTINVIAGGPRVGKSTFVQQLAWEFVRNPAVKQTCVLPINVAPTSYKAQLFEMMDSKERNGSEPVTTWDTANIEFYLPDRAGMPLREQLWTHIDECFASSPGGGVVVIDSFGALMKRYALRTNRQAYKMPAPARDAEQINISANEILGVLRDLAQDHDLAVICVAELPEKDALVNLENETILADRCWSEPLENKGLFDTADSIIVLEKAQGSRNADLHVVKVRGGSSRSYKMQFKDGSFKDSDATPLASTTRAPKHQPAVH